MNKHTPAPWVVCSGGSNLRTGKPSEANARLIAAAPELLDALIEALPYIEATLSNHDAGCQRHPSTEYAREGIASDLDQIKTAIAKARGDRP